MNKSEHLGGDRRFTYIKPSGKRASEYEELTLHVQPDPEKWQWQGWLSRFPDGRPAWDVDSTALRCEDWFRFRDPSAMWQRPYVATQAARSRHIETLIRTAGSEFTVEGFSEGWGVKLLGQYLQASAHQEYGLFRAFAFAQREALSDSIGNTMTYNASDKVRYAQDVVMYSMELETVIEGFESSSGRSAWMNDPILQGAREVVENIMATRDWAEITVATNLLFEPLWGSLFRREFFMRFGAHNGDAVTPLLVETAESDMNRNIDWTKTFIELVTQDKSHGEANSRVLREWLEKWRPLVDNACDGLRPLFDIPKMRPVAFDEALESARKRARETLGNLDFDAE